MGGNLNDLLAQFKTNTAAIADSIGSTVASNVADSIQKAEVTSQSFIPKLKLGPVLPSDAQANTVAIRQQLAKTNKVSIPPGRVEVDGDIRVASESIIEGLGTNLNPSEIAVVTGSPTVLLRSSAHCWYSVFQSNTDPTGAEALVGPTFGLPIGPAHNVTIRNLKINASFNSQRTTLAGIFPTTCEAVSIEGTGLLAENVTVAGTARGVEGGECFPIRVYASENNKNTETRPSVIRNCRMNSVGQAGSTHVGGPGHEITFFSIVGSKMNIINNPIIEGCIIDGIQRSAAQPSPLQVLHTAYCNNAVLRDNVVSNSDAICYYQDTGTNYRTVLRDNLFVNVFRGIFLNAVSDFYMSDMLVTNNVFEIYKTKPSWNVNATPAAILLQKTDTSPTTGFNRCQFVNNTISAPTGSFGTQLFYTRGLYLELRNPSHASRLVFANNIVDVPLAGTGVWYPQGWRSLLSIYVSNISAWNSNNPCLHAWDNRDSSGFLPALTLTDGSYIPKLSIPQ